MMMPEEPQSVFAAAKPGVYTRYAVTLQFRYRLVGGVPRDPEMMERWIRSKAGITDEMEIQHLLIETLQQTGIAVRDGMTMEEMREAAAKVTELKQNGFKRFPDGRLAFEARQIKAGIKEAVNILFAGTRWGRTSKGPKAFTAERVFVEPAPLIPLLHEDGTPYTEPDTVQTRVGHVSGPGGPRAILQNEEVVERPLLRFEILVVDDGIQPEHWGRIWTLMEENGLGTARSQGYGQFVVTEWRKH